MKDIYRLKNLENCTVEILGKLKTLYLENISGCKISTGIIDGSLFGNKLENSEISVVSHQIRIHNAKNVKFEVFVTWILEKTALKFMWKNSTRNQSAKQLKINSKSPSFQKKKIAGKTWKILIGFEMIHLRILHMKNN